METAKGTIDNREKLIQQLLSEKERKRLELASLPISEKIEIMIEMQKRANAVRRFTGRPEKPVWDLT